MALGGGRLQRYYFSFEFVELDSLSYLLSLHIKVIIEGGMLI